MNHKFDSCKWLGDLLSVEKRKSIIDTCVKFLRKHKDKFDFIAFRGMSGAMIAGPVAFRLHKYLTLIRKDGGRGHSNHSVEGMYTGRYVILDDFISSGDTVQAILEALPNAHCIFMYMYRYNGYYHIYDRRYQTIRYPVTGSGFTSKEFKKLVQQRLKLYRGEYANTRTKTNYGNSFHRPSREIHGMQQGCQSVG